MNPLEIREILALPLHHRASVSRLLELYRHIKDTWTTQAFNELRDSNNINLRTTQGRCSIARLAGEIELRYCDTSPEEKIVNSSVEDIVSPSNEPGDEKVELQTTKILVKVIGLLLPGKELNGRQLTPAFRVFGMATTKDMLRHNFRKLRTLEHPDVSKYESEIASARYAFVTKLYRVLSSNWDDKYDPTLPLSSLALSKAMDVKLPFEPSSFATASP